MFGWGFKEDDLLQEKLHNVQKAINCYNMMKDSLKIYERAKSDVYHLAGEKEELGRPEDLEYFRNKMIKTVSTLTKDEMIGCIIGNDYYSTDKKRRLAYTKEFEVPSRNIDGTNTDGYNAWIRARVDAELAKMTGSNNSATESVNLVNNDKKT